MEVLVELFAPAGRAHQGLGDCNDLGEEKWLNIAKTPSLKDFLTRRYLILMDSTRKDLILQV